MPAIKAPKTLPPDIFRKTEIYCTMKRAKVVIEKVVSGTGKWTVEILPWIKKSKFQSLEAKLMYEARCELLMATIVGHLKSGEDVATKSYEDGIVAARLYIEAKLAQECKEW